MVNCIYTGGINSDEFDRFKTIINEKYNPAKASLLLIENRVQTCYNRYLNNFQNIELLPNSEFSNIENNEKEYLKKCYTSETQSFKLLRGRIFENQSIYHKANCPYCLLNEPDTLDHYLGKTEFPEYSILVKNLVPCCPSCNTKKGDVWRLDSKRRYIHFYNDNFLDQRFFYANLIFIGNDVPIIEFNLIKPETLTDYQYEIITSHFNDLNLIERYRGRSNAILSTEIQIIQSSYLRGDTIDTIKQTAIDKYNNIVGYGLNYWQKNLYEAISNNIDNILNIQ